MAEFLKKYHPEISKFFKRVSLYFFKLKLKRGIRQKERNLRESSALYTDRRDFYIGDKSADFKQRWIEL